jgi:hypothetical protein
MDIKKYRPILEIVIGALVVYAVHKGFFFLNGSPQFRNFHTPLESVYGFFFLCSATIIFILIQVKERALQSVGFAFLFLTCAKMGVAYAFLRPILKSGSDNIATEKINYFIVFALFLAIETIVTIRILNNKQ